MNDVNEDLLDELEKANSERQAIVKKYLLGRKAENLINQWVRGEFPVIFRELHEDFNPQEDPDFGLVYKIDR
jgi:hypothetical protein